ncbi:MAG TPA: ROK family protein [Roseiflexaceae bacterium]|nr:ROK family protein [Roseiflexaceae bacterium]HMP40648.1 ROK family protein [Roseiflexaceae bacterium]
MTDPKTLIEERLARNTWGLLGTQGYILGLDVGSYGLRASLIDLHSHKYMSLHRDTNDRSPQLVDQAINLGQQLLHDAGVTAGRLVRVGAGFGGPIDARHGIILMSPRAEGWERYPLRERLEDAFDAAVVVDNDANLIALAEATFGVGHDAQHLFYIHLSSGVGGGLVLNGHLYEGATTTAGEIGHAAVGLSDPARPGQPPRTLEQQLSLSGLMRRAAELGLETNRLEEIFGDHPAAKQVVHEAIEQLAATLAQISALLDPQMIVIGGVVARSGGDRFINAVSSRMQSFLDKPVERKIAVVPAMLGFDSVAIGSVALALQSMQE